MIYATRDRRHAGQMLVEFKSRKALDAANEAEQAQGNHYRPVTREYAHKWVKDGGIHETGLYVDEGRVKYAPADPEGY